MPTRLIPLAAAPIALAIATLATAVPALAQTTADDSRFQQAQARFDREYRIFRDEAARYQSTRSRTGYQDTTGGYRRAPDPAVRGSTNQDYADERNEGDYDAARYYRPGTQERTLSTNERVYAGQDGRYYCKRSDGTTGLIIGAAGGGILGNVIDGGRSRTVGTLLGAAIGGLAGRSVDQNNAQVRCR